MHRRQPNPNPRFRGFMNTYHRTQMQIQEDEAIELEDLLSDSNEDIALLSTLVKATRRNSNPSQENSTLLEDTTGSTVREHAPQGLLRGGSKDDEIRDQLACLICKNLLLPPITLCIIGHVFCIECKKAFRPCPTCIGEVNATRNLNKILPFCLVKCKNTDFGCKVILSGRELSQHHQSCEYRHLMCRKCSTEVPNELFLDHLRVIEKVEIQMTKECVTVFEIPDDEVIWPITDVDGGNFWGPTWIHCYDNDFFCFLEHSQRKWWIWVGALAPKNICANFRCSITIRNTDNRTEMAYLGTVHPVQTQPNDVWKSAECLIFCDLNFKNFFNEGGIEVIIRIDNEYKAPRNSYGALVIPPTIAFWNAFRKIPTPHNIPLPCLFSFPTTGLVIPNLTRR